MRELKKIQLLRNILNEVTKRYDEVIAFQKKELEERFKMAIRDPLTGLYNRSYLIEFADKSLQKHIRDEENNYAYVIFFDLDNFKYVNDTFGHKEGDKVLKKVANILKKSFRSYDIVARLGGDEFIVFLDSSKIKESMFDIDKYLERIVGKIEAKFEKYNISASYGVAIFPKDGTTIEDLIDIADQRMYELKKEKKRNR
ncbi:GGDEF domain-containing protein [Hydrogenimonas thermophila]|uniref:diguanylate cyclase n=1 Tax=Hydrogenimonas thermophila TaxID=223786 RepID=A0A1I5N3N1_9BACT|nr:GGDEF domain-containing protein [Hydrogenimonas thermophila]WOE70287.1 GGDEF domain-containing protein [Hydrogenimonas thermophila]WOE72804.1 GGDEF domain-containing protein [Hydrogenimonas thermophila]SFP16320.1 diguanylate cyclase (GGDEF) domain-containing protein [Hydrogenimonas thermophila]